MFRSWLGLGLLSGAMAPDFTLSDQFGKMHHLQDYRGQWVVLFFYPRDETRGCTREACSFRDFRSDYEKLGVKVLGISVDSVESHKQFSDRFQLNFPILSDHEKSVSEAYEVLLPFGVDARVTFLIDPQGIIRENFKFIPWSDYAAEIKSRILPYINR